MDGKDINRREFLFTIALKKNISNNVENTALKKINTQQLITLIILSPIYIIPVYAFIGGAYIGGVIFLLIILFCVLRLIWLLGTPDNLEFNYSENAAISIQSNICPVCGKNKSGSSKLLIGYHKRHWHVSYRIFYIKYSIEREQLTRKINICQSCKENYLFFSKYKILALLKRDPSKEVLQRKVGYLRGPAFPFEKWNVS
jgi:hypothetical protein